MHRCLLIFASGLTFAMGAMYGSQTVSPVLNANVTVDTGSILRQIPATVYGSNLQWVWDGYSLWNEQNNSPDPVLSGFASSLGVSLFRYPGGMYADFFHWQSGVGANATRPIVPFRVGDAEAGKIDFGTDEALAFAKQNNAGLLFTVNVGTGTPAEAAAWVHYVNQTALRVQYWELGNELYINDGSAAQNAITMTPQVYAQKVVQFAQAMRAADPRIKIGAIGGQNSGAYNIVAYPNWDQVVLQTAGNQIDFLAVHNSYAPVNVSDSDQVRPVYSALLAAPSLIAQNLDELRRQIQTYAPARASNISVAVTEWGPLFQSTPTGRYAQHTRTLGSALFDVGVLKALVESPVTQIANFHVFNDLSIMCWVCSKNGSYPPVWTATAEAMAFQLFTQHFGTQLVTSSVSGPSYNSPAIGLLPSVPSVPYLDIVSSLSPDGKTLYVIGINKNFDSDIEAAISIRDFTPSAQASAWTLNGTGIDANTGTSPLKVPGTYWAAQAQDPVNPQFDHGGPGQVTVTKSSTTVSGAFTYRFPAHSVSALQITAARGAQTVSTGLHDPQAPK